jgi:diguanylate cyclase (GGDEF)-like protein
VRARVRDHVELKQACDVLLSLAATDGLPGLANRRRFDEALGVECKRLARTQAPLALIMLDVDFFKAFNDAYGHLKGDDCLCQLAGVLAAATRRGPDLAARYGCEQFACILPETSLAGAVAVAERIRDRVEVLGIPHSGSKVAPLVTPSSSLPGRLKPDRLGRIAGSASGQNSSTMTATWRHHEKHGQLTAQADLPDEVFAFPKQRKEPLTDASHVRNAVARFDQVTGVSDADRDLAWSNILEAADYYGVDVSEQSWHELGEHPQRH